MNKLLVPNGGMPLYGDDFAFLDAAAREAFSGVIREFAQAAGGYMILGGCETSTSGPSTVVASGFVLLNYEICYFPGGSIVPTPGEAAGFDLDVTYDSAGLKTFANASTNDTYQVRRAKLISAATDLAVNQNRLSQLIYDSMADRQTSSATIGVFNTWTKEVANSPICRRHFNVVHVTGGFVVGTINSSTFTKIALLPSGYRPAQRYKAIVAAYGTVGFGNVMLEFYPNGEVYAISTDANTYDLISVNESFFAT